MALLKSILVSPIVAVLAQSDIASLLNPISDLPGNIAGLSSGSSSVPASNPEFLGGIDSLISEALTMPASGSSSQEVTNGYSSLNSLLGNIVSGIGSPIGSLFIPPSTSTTSSSNFLVGTGIPSQPDPFSLPGMSLSPGLPSQPTCTLDTCYNALLSAGASATSFCNSYFTTVTATPSPIEKRAVTTLMKKKRQVCAPKSLVSANVAIIPTPAPVIPADVCTAGQHIASACGCLGVFAPQVTTVSSDFLGGSELSSVMDGITMMLSAVPTD